MIILALLLMTPAVEEIGSEVAGEVAAMALDLVMPGISLVRWGVKAFMAASRPDRQPRGVLRSDALRLSCPGPMSVVQWLVQTGTSVVLQDGGMSEMMRMIVSGELSLEAGQGACPRQLIIVCLFSFRRWEWMALGGTVSDVAGQL
jgi:hypothetical protein